MKTFIDKKNHAKARELLPGIVHEFSKDNDIIAALIAEVVNFRIVLSDFAELYENRPIFLLHDGADEYVSEANKKQDAEFKTYDARVEEAIAKLLALRNK